MKYIHSAIVCLDINKISSFYINVLGCKRTDPEMEMHGEWLEKGTGVKNAKAKSVTLQLPGYENDGPCLEIFQYSDVLEKERAPNANSKGIAHLAFGVDDVEATLKKVLENGGSRIGEPVVKEFKTGTLFYVYAADPERNIIEIQNWKNN